MGKTKFGVGAITKKTPKKVRIIVGTLVILTMVATFIISGDPGIPDDLKVRLNVYLKGLDMLILGAGEMFGLQEENNEPLGI